MVDGSSLKRRRRADRQAQLAAANAAGKAGDWKTAAAHLGALVLARPDDHYLRMKQGRAFSKSGDFAGAAAAFRQAVILKPERPEGHLELGRALRLIGQRKQAVQSLSQAAALSSAYVEARRELIIAGGGEQLSRIAPAPVPGGLVESFPAESYAAFREHTPILPPPSEKGRDRPLSILVDVDDALPADVRGTILSLLNQTHSRWTAYVLSEPEELNHPLWSLGFVDARVVFTQADAIPQIAAFGCEWLSLTAGTVVDREALAWMAYVAAVVAPTAYSDHEVISTDWKMGCQRLRPALQPMPDPDDLTSTPEPPVLVLLPSGEVDALVTLAAVCGYREARAATLGRLMAQGSAAHIPRILASREQGKEGAPRRPLITTAESRGADTELLVIIPTRDGGDMLRTCVESLHRTATRPLRMRFLIIDNGSRQPGTLAILRKLSRRKDVDILTVDEPFNWSRLNNLAVQSRPLGDLVFVNDDTEMLSRGWDERIAEKLARPEIGLVGARLLYPDSTVQHAGIAMGVADGMPIHEGVRVEPDDGGPLGRWRRLRSVAAVTGAFIAIRRSVFEAAGGFDAVDLAVAYNDIDLCLRVRELGLRVLYDGELELLHHESISRGQNDNAAKIAWDHGELSSLHRRWGPALFQDPSRNPQWADQPLAPFDGFRDLSPEATVQHIKDSVSDPWRIVRSG